MSDSNFTGFYRVRTSSRRVRWGDRAARTAITAGGLLTIVAVALVCAFLVWVVLPLFVGGDVAQRAATDARTPPARIAYQAVDPYRQVLLQLRGDGIVELRALASGQRVATGNALTPSPEGQPPVALPPPAAMAVRAGVLAAGRPDGTVTLTELGIDVVQLPLRDAPPELQSLVAGAGVAVQRTWYERTQGNYRTFDLRCGPMRTIALADRPILALDLVRTGDVTTVAAITAGGRLELRSLERSVNPFTDEVTDESRGTGIDLAELTDRTELPDRVLVVGAGDNVYLLWNDGDLVRVDTRSVEQPRLAERLDLLEDDARVTCSSFLIGRNTLLVGDDRGRVRSWFRSKPAEPRGNDGSQLDRAHEFRAAEGPVVALSVSQRSRLFAIGHGDGTVAVCHATSERIVATARVPADEPLLALSMTPKEDGLVATTPRALHRFDLDPGHPEFTFASAITPVWYEGYADAEHVWQSTGGTDDFEPKFGLWPLVFGTLKATLYCLLFGVPIALLAAIYTSEFLAPRQRGRIKPLVESMASLPSVVLGFLAALVFAPVVESALTTILASFFTVPLVWLLGAQVVQALPSARRLFAERHRLLFAGVVIPLGLALGATTGAAVETLFFGGDFQRWLAAIHAQNESPGSPLGGWFLALLPVTALGSALLVGRTRVLAHLRAAGALRLGLGAVTAVLGALLLAAAVSATGLDLRGTLVDTYVQRNALVVGFVMGFAVVPIIYTIAEDALIAVPEHLRAASLGAGATPWQTATRIILPTAMSGIFSAVMVGLGRAVGETMIVLMAAGNTPVLELNPFNGFRTLAGNIAFELPEAVRDSTHYRMLYLAALVLFAMTFLLNTVAELVRQRFRRRAWQL